MKMTLTMEFRSDVPSDRRLLSLTTCAERMGLTLAVLHDELTRLSQDSSSDAMRAVGESLLRTLEMELGDDLTREVTK